MDFPLYAPDTLTITNIFYYFWFETLHSEIMFITKRLFEEELDLEMFSKTETYMLQDCNKCQEENLNFISTNNCLKHRNSFTSCIDLNNKANSFQVEIIDEKLNRNHLFSKIINRINLKEGNLKSSIVTSFKKHHMIIILKTEKLGDDIFNLLQLHNSFKHSIDKTPNSLESFRKEPIKDRRILSIENSTNSIIDFPTNLKIFRYKGVNCTKFRIISNDEMTTIKTLNIIKNKLPKIYNECIFSGPTIFQPPKASIDYNSTTSCSSIRKSLCSERPLSNGDYYNYATSYNSLSRKSKSNINTESVLL